MSRPVNVVCWHQAASEPWTRTSLRPSHGARRELKEFRADASTRLGCFPARTCPMEPFGQGVAVHGAGSTVGRRRPTECSWLGLVGGRLANGCLLVHAPRPLVDAPIEMAEQLAPSRGLCRGALGAASCRRWADGDPPASGEVPRRCGPAPRMRRTRPAARRCACGCGLGAGGIGRARRGQGGAAHPWTMRVTSGSTGGCHLWVDVADALVTVASAHE